MLSIIEITLALILGILWGLYLETKFLIMASIFLYFCVLMFCKKYNLISVILLAIVVISCIYTKERIQKFDTKYLDNTLVNMNITIISHLEESEYAYKYQGKNEKGDKFILYFKKSENSIFKIGEILKVNGEFNIPELARNRGGFNYRRYLNSNGIYGTVKVSFFEYVRSQSNGINLIYAMQNLIYDNFQSVLPKEFARRIEWNADRRNEFYFR